MMRRGGNVLVLDEPTNDLDLSTLRVLEESLARFDGTVITVSHDRYFLDRVCTHILSIDACGNVHCDVGNYSEYKERHQARFQMAAPSIDKPLRESRKAEQVPKLTWKEERELESMEENILSAEQAVTALEALMCDPLFLVERRNEIASTNTRLEEARLQIQALFARWEVLEEKRRLYQQSREARQG
jgi:ATP-binding cassette subfamily F protein uup